MKRTPTELWNDHKAKTDHTRQQRDLEYQQQKEASRAKPKGGLFSQLTKGLTDVAHQTGSFLSDACNSAENSVRESDSSSQQKQWASVFTNLAASEKLEAGYRCKYLNGRQQGIDGTVYISTRFVSFIPVAPRQDQPPFFEEFRNIVTVVQSRTLGVPCIQLYTNSGFVFQFSHFVTDVKRQVGSLMGTVKYTPFEAFEIYVDKHWRSNTAVPVPGYQYQPRT